VNGAGRPVPRNPATVAPTGESGHAPGGPPALRAARADPPRSNRQGASPGALWALFPLAFAVAVLAGVWDCAGKPGRPQPEVAAPAAAPAAPPPAQVGAQAGAGPTPAGGEAPLSAEETLRRFYLRLSEGDLVGAHAFLSSEVHQQYPRPRFDDGWRAVRRVTLLGASPLPGAATAGEVRLRACVEVVQRAGQGEQRALYQGQVTLPREGQAYRVGPSALGLVDRC
jgi:hypothetical protein